MEIKDIQKLAKLSRIEISEVEQKELLKDMESILGYVNEIQEVVTEEKINEAPEHRNVMREDCDPHESGEYSKDILKEAPDTEGEYVKVKQIL